MEPNLIDLFTSKEFKFLRDMQYIQENARGGPVVKGSQECIAKRCGVSKVTGQKIIQQLVAAECLRDHKNPNGYQISQKGQFVLDYCKLLEQYNGGNKNG